MADNIIKKMIADLQQMEEELSNLISNREETFDSRSEKWQESEKGEEYQEQTDQLGSVKGSIESAIDELTELFES